MKKVKSFVSYRGSLFVATAATAAVLGLGSATQGAAMTYTPSNATTDTWSLGTNWSATPASAATTTLTFVGTNTTVLADGLTNTNTDNINGGFQANIINLQGTGPTSGAATINIAVASGSYLNLVNNGTLVTNNPVINLNANAGSAGLSYNVSAPITVSTSAAGPVLTLVGAGTAAFNFSGGITTNAAGFYDTAAGTVTLRGATNTFGGGFSLSPTAPGEL